MASIAYLKEKGISEQYTGKSLCSNTNTTCNDSVTRTISWTGLVGLMSVSDIMYANGWLYDQGRYNYIWSISPSVGYDVFYSSYIYTAGGMACGKRHSGHFGMVFPSVYLKTNIKIIGGNGDDKPYILAI